jgi:cyclase
MSATSTPVIASGGAGELRHFIEVANTGVDAILAASVFHSGTFSIGEVKHALSAAGFVVRK